MAVFIIRTRLGPSTLFSYPPAPYFTDVPPTAFGFSDIQRLRSDNITSGCTATQYCPSQPTTRGQIAVFIMRGLFNQLLPPGTPVLTGISGNPIYQGQTTSFVVTGANTHFDSTTTAYPISGVTILAVAANSATSAAVSVRVASNAPVQPQSITLITGSEEAVLPNGLIVQ